MTALAILVAILQVGAFCGAAYLGGRTVDRIGNRFLSMILAGVLLVAVGGYMVACDGVITNEWVRGLGLAALGFAGGLVMFIRNREMNGK